MGYNTYFSDQTPMTEEHLKKLADIAGYRISFNEDHKWYEWKEHMAELSVHFPEVEFKISGEGEETDDLWRATFKNGMMWIGNAVITYPEFDESAMVRAFDPLPQTPVLPDVPEGLTTGVKAENNIDWDF